ncbi:MAG TPA: hypothetical protein VFW64_02905 [Pseudonocardiaceae bacterium]|nr:hypothetical protein [Pseudonocardiaceae bacterium]
MHPTVVDLVVDVHESIPQSGEATEPPGQRVVDDAVLSEDREAVAEVTRGPPAFGGDDVVGQIDAGLRRDLDKVTACVHLVAQVFGDRQVTEAPQLAQVAGEQLQALVNSVEINH